MNQAQLDRIIELLRTESATLAPGLTAEEIVRVEETFGFQFPPDLRQLLETALPQGDRFPDWRTGNKANLQPRLDWPADGICFDVEHAGFWMEDWGPRPDNLGDAFTIARRQVAQAPRLIPICGHRYLPADPPEAGNPVFSVYQTDIIYYGVDLPDYFEREFARPRPQQPVGTVQRPIRFWSDFATAQVPLLSWSRNQP